MCSRSGKCLGFHLRAKAGRPYMKSSSDILMGGGEIICFANEEFKIDRRRFAFSIVASATTWVLSISFSFTPLCPFSI